MASTIKIKRSNVAGKTPTTSDIDTGEIALNIKDQKLYSSNGSSVFELGVYNGGLVSTTTKTFDAIIGSDTVVTGVTAAVSTNYLQVANAATTYATKSNPTTSDLLAHTGRATISTNLAVSGNTTISGTLGVTGVATFAAGTALLPALTTSGDTNTGVWFPAADTVAASTAGTERMRIDSSGNVGIGTGSPGTYGKFVTTASGYNLNAVFLSDATASNWARADWDNQNVAYNGIIYQDQSGLFSIRNDGANAIAFLTNGANERMRIDSSGLVGIGTSSAAAYGTLTVGQSGQPTGSEPSSRPNIEIWQGSPSINDAGGIDLRGSSSGSGYGFRMSAIDSTGVHLVIGNRSNSETYTERMRIDSSGNVGIGTASPLGFAGYGWITVNGASAGAILSLTTADSENFRLQSVNDQATYFNNLTAFPLLFQTNNAERMRIDPAGNVGIGTSVPGYKLTVAGLAAFGTASGVYGDYADMRLETATGYGWRMGTSSTGSTHGYFYIQGTTDNFVSSFINGLFIDTSGNVGIGTSSPGAKLDLTGGNLKLSGETSSEFTGMWLINTGSSASVYRGLYYDGRNENNIAVANMLVDVATDGSSAWSWGTTPAGSRTVDRRVERMRIDSEGNVGIGTSSPSYQLELSTNSAAKPTSGVWTVVSDGRIKNETGEYTKGLDAVCGLRPITYTYKENSGFKDTTSENISIIAQEAQVYFPECVNSIKGELDGEETDILNWDGHALTFALVNAVKELKAKIETLEARVA